MSGSYSVNDIENLSQIERVRRFPTRFLGGEVFTTAAREIVDNAADEVGRGFADSIQIIFHPDGSVEVCDNGRGLPVDFDPDMVTETGHRGVNGIVKTLGTLGAGGNYSKDASSGVITAGVHGEGGAATNAISRRFDVTVYRDGRLFKQQFRAGVPGHFAGDLFDPDSPFTANEGERIQGKRAPRETAPIPGAASGTSVRFLLDRSLAPDIELDIGGIVQRANIAARLRPGMRLSVTRDGDTQTFSGPDYGTDAVLGFMTAENMKTSLSVKANFEFTRAKEKIPASIELSAAPATGDATQVSVMNTVWTPRGGRYQDIAAEAVGEGLASRQVRSLERQTGEPYPSATDFAAVTSMAVHIAMSASPKFDGQDKSAVVGERSLNDALATAVTRQVTMWAANPANSRTLLGWATAALAHARTVRKIEAAKTATRTLSAAAGGSNLSLPDKYLPCANTGRGSGAEVHFCEGDSALGTIKNARDARFQAAYPLRGKTMNTHGKPLSACRKNVEFAAIEAILGCGIRETCNPEACRFDRIFFTTDADVDGYNISSSLLDMFVENYAPLIDAGMVFIAQPPLFIVTVKNSSEKQYCIDEEARDQAIASIEANGSNAEVQRCKGLGEMTPHDFSETVMDPQTRTIFQLTYAPEAEANTFDVVFGTSAAARRKWISEMAVNADISVAM